MTFTAEQLEDVRRGNLKALVELDTAGLVMGPGESAEEYAERLNRIQGKIGEMDAAFAEHGYYEVDTMRLLREEQIPTDIVQSVGDETWELFRFRIDWVPAFFIDPEFSWLFAGCAFYFIPESFALLVIRKSFSYGEKWFIYNRREILSHELCHIARMVLNSDAYEERFAYMTSLSGFRKQFGGVFHSASDSFTLLGCTFVLLFAQILQTMLYPWVPVWAFWLVLAGVVGRLFVRDRRCRRRLVTARKNLETAGYKQALPVLFRCTDDEIGRIAGLNNPDELHAWLSDQRNSELRWQVIDARFSGN